MMRCMGALGIMCLLAAGCVNQQTRMQMAEESEKERDLELLTIGDFTDVGNKGAMKVQSVGLVTGLAGTGHCPAGYYRNLLEQYLLKTSSSRNGEIALDRPEVKIRKVLEDPNNALVIVTAYIPEGARRGDRFDVEVELPPGSKTSSLVGGYLELSQLRVWEAAANLSEKHARDNTLLASQVFAQAKGPLVVGLSNHSDVHELKRGKVWQGGMSRIDRPYAFLMKMNGTGRSIHITNAVAERINYLFQDDPRSRPLLSEQRKYNLQLVGNITDQLNSQTNAGGLLHTQMAKAVSKEAINVCVPFAYRFNHERYLRVARLTPLRESDQNMLQDPRDTVRAAMRLEAMGRDSIPILREGLESEHALVRFASAEALAYLSSTFGIEVLTQVANQHPLFAYHSAIALANLGESVCRDKLGALLTSPEPVVQTAAFHALSLLDEADPHLGGHFLNETCWLHLVPQSPTPMVSFSTSKRAQVILFGRNIMLASATRMIVGKNATNNFTVVTGESDGKCVVKHISTQGEKQRVCAPRVQDILVAFTELGAGYPDIVDFLSKSHDYRKINCPVVNWSVPEVALETLLEAGQGLK